MRVRHHFGSAAGRRQSSLALMAEDDTLARVQEDLAAGRVSLARQRLRGLVGSYPQRLDLREQLADLYRRDGVTSQAGRWSFLSENVDPAEIRAFEREYSDPVRRMRALAWHGPEDTAGSTAAARLAAVRAEAERHVGHTVSWDKLREQPDYPRTWGDRLGDAVMFTVLLLFLLGGIAFVVQGVQVVIGWLNG